MTNLPVREDASTLADVLERVLDKGLVIAGDIRVNLLDIELLTIKIRLHVASVDKAAYDELVQQLIDFLDGDKHLGGSAQPAAVVGFPLITVPAGYAVGHLPLGLTFMGPARSEPTLIKLAYAFEQAHPVRRAPSFRPTILDLP